MENKNKYLEVKKNRFDGELGRVYLRFDQASQSFVSKSQAEVQIMAQEQAQNPPAGSFRRGSGDGA